MHTNRALYAYKNILTSEIPQKSTKIKLYKSLIKSNINVCSRDDKYDQKTKGGTESNRTKSKQNKNGAS